MEYTETILYENGKPTEAMKKWKAEQKKLKTERNPKAADVEPEQVKSSLCDVCGHELLHEQAKLSDMHVGCAEKKFLAYCITINGSTEYHKNKKSFYESLKTLIEEIEDIGDDNNIIHITRKYITNIKYKNFPESEGF